jgi:DNA-binding transcriptional ArsR family regulator
MTTDELDPLIHVPARLRIVATLAALEDGDSLSFTRLQDMIGLTPGNLIIHLRKLEDADYISSEKTGNGAASRTTVALTSRGRAALDAYTRALRDLLAGSRRSGLFWPPTPAFRRGPAQHHTTHDQASPDTWSEYSGNQAVNTSPLNG